MGDMWHAAVDGFLGAFRDAYWVCRVALTPARVIARKRREYLDRKAEVERDARSRL